MLRRRSARQTLCLMIGVVASLWATPRAAWCGEEPAPPPPGKLDVPPVAAGKGGTGGLPEIDWWAVNQSFVEEKDAIVLSGSAWVRYASFKLEADHIVFFRTSRELYAEGNIRLREGESEVAAQVAYLDLRNDRGYLVDATVRASRPVGKARPAALPPPYDADAAYAKAAGNEAGFLSSKDPQGLYVDIVDDPQSRLNFVFSAEKIVRESRLHYYAEDSFVTNDDMAEPMYGVKVARLDFYVMEAPDPDLPGKTYLRAHKIVGKGARLKIGPVTLFPFPTITYDLTKHLGYVREDWGQSSQWGPYSLFRIGWGLGGRETHNFDPERLYFDVDTRLSRGPALGTEFRYKTGQRPEDPQARAAFERGQGRLRLYGLYEMFTDDEDDADRALRNQRRRVLAKLDGDPRRKYDANLLFLARRTRDGAVGPKYSADYYQDDFRWLADFQHHQPLRHLLGFNDIQFDFKYQQQSDRDFLLEYFENNYYRQNQPEALASVRQAGDNYQVELLYRGSPQDFDGVPPRSPFTGGTFTVYEPAFTYSLASYALPRGFYLSGEAQVARLRQVFDPELLDQDDLDAGRAYMEASLQRPFHWFGLDFHPYVGGQVAAYDDSRDGGATWQGAARFGVDISRRFYGYFPDVVNEELGINGLRHIVEPRIEYVGVSDTPRDPLDILDFDEVDDLRGLHRLRLAMDQYIQTGASAKDGAFAGSDVAGLSLALDVFPRESDRARLTEGAWTDLLSASGFLNVRGVAQLHGGIGYALSHSRVETAHLGLTIDPGGRWRLSVGERFNYRDSDREIIGSDWMYFKFEYQMSERWGFAFEQTQQRRQSLLDRKGVQTQRITLTRRYGPIVGQLSYRINKNTRENSFNVSLSPAFAYRNLVVPMQDLLVEPSEVAEPEEAPEERNFDPFNFIRVRSKKPRPPPPSPPAPPPPKAAPAPEATPEPKAEAPVPMRPADVVPLDGHGPSAALPPGTSSPSREGPGEAVDLDDWAAYPPATSAR